MMKRIISIVTVLALSLAATGQNDMGGESNSGTTMKHTEKMTGIADLKPGAAAGIANQKPGAKAGSANLKPGTAAEASVSQSVETAGIPCQMEELTSPQFPAAVELAGGVCVIPIGIIEKHSTHLPLGTDLYEARAAVIRASEKEYAVVFPPYYAGQIFEAKNQPGTIAYSNDLIWQMLDETCQELSRNGLKKIILFNGHGGSTNFLNYFCQSQLASGKDYVVVLFQPGPDKDIDNKINTLKKAKLDGHAGEEETAMMSFIRPDLVDTAAFAEESGADLRRLAEMPHGFTGIHWYARFPNHYAGDLVRVDPKLGDLLIEKDAIQLAALIRWLKNNDTVEQLQEEFFKRSADPLK